MLISAQLKHKNACRANFRLAVVGATGILYKVVERKTTTTPLLFLGELGVKYYPV
ncbi:hypothetical protein [Hoylesella loescheii]|uniref:hypothetical protein n=1 Tax=Hoylesella loescheii TaxID=840 RepID=UPI0028E35727|nr:hypothetical protein [Hoylesella loescheii]